MIDIVERLRALADHIDPFRQNGSHTCTEAVEEIERWRKLARLRQEALSQNLDRIRELESENHQLRKLLLRIDKALDGLDSQPSSESTEDSRRMPKP
jgi:uncharacterized coiled-coil DUF342 family protein